MDAGCSSPGTLSSKFLLCSWHLSVSLRQSLGGEEDQEPPHFPLKLLNSDSLSNVAARFI